MKKSLFLLLIAAGPTTDLFTLPKALNNKFEILEFNSDEVEQLENHENTTKSPVQLMQKLLTVTPSNKKTDDMLLACKSIADQKLAGSLNYIIDPNSDYAEINIVTTQAGYERQGVASLLLQKAQENCTKQNIKNLKLSVASNNHAAIQCYKKFGFYRSIGSRLYDLLMAWKNLNLYRQDSITMVKKI